MKLCREVKFSHAGRNLVRYVLLWEYVPRQISPTSIKKISNTLTYTCTLVYWLTRWLNYSVGRAQFKTCPDEPASKECRGTTHLEGEEQGSVEFDARLEYNYGGDCGLKQSVRQMDLNRIDDNGNSESLFICSNLGSYNRRRNCTNSTHVSITYQGEDKYDLKLSLHSLNISSSGRYQLQVNVAETEGRTNTILKEFNVTVRGKLLISPVQPMYM